MSTITDIGDALRAEPRSYAEMPAEWQAALTSAMRPDRLHGFDGQQANWIYSWLLQVTTEQLADLQALHPHQYAAREATDGTLYLSAALLTDALDGRRLSAAEPILTGLTLRHDSVVNFPEPISEI